MNKMERQRVFSAVNHDWIVFAIIFSTMEHQNSVPRQKLSQKLLPPTTDESKMCQSPCMCDNQNFCTPHGGEKDAIGGIFTPDTRIHSTFGVRVYVV
jgi:hypothetical protein